MPDERYSLPAQALHWGVALLMLAAVVVIGQAEGLPPGPERGQLFGLHKSLGAAVLLLVLVRAAVRALRPPPPLPESVGRPVRAAAAAGHGLLYLLMLAIPVSGLVMSWSAGRPVSLFGLAELPSLLGPDKALAAAAKEAHGLLVAALWAALGAHVAAALWHQFVRRDGVLGRMLPFRLPGGR